MPFLNRPAPVPKTEATAQEFAEYTRARGFCSERRIFRLRFTGRIKRSTRHVVEVVEACRRAHTKHAPSLFFEHAGGLILCPRRRTAFVRIHAKVNVRDGGRQFDVFDVGDAQRRQNAVFGQSDGQRQSRFDALGDKHA